ncbi:elongation factor 3 [Lysinibacillus contaminans]|uniref:Ribosome protection protein VmlR n=1 Tax=Lysinibacillus contaminans TaxID=1293441 RepID=A0ABR5JXU4_9BACI|nr:ABC-F type ribosomal protection protein [Lysinibacillus contaminans]KOS66900.1 elongation factor 3 [Lysinibacillus contaminans]
MKEILKLRNISYEIMNTLIFENINATAKQGEVIGIIGKNGAGKSTLLQLIKGLISPIKGHLQWLQNVDITYVEQECERYLERDVSAKEADLLAKWGVPTVSYASLSGGEKLKIRLVNGFAQDAQLLLLDEPTNHLDEQGTAMLIDEIKNYPGTILVVSHDRYFLDKVTTKIWSLEKTKLIEHSGNYSSYMEARKLQRLSQERAYEKQQKNMERIEAQMKELTSWSQKAHAQSTKQEGFKEHYRVKAKRMDAQVKSKKKRLEKELLKEKVERVVPDDNVLFSVESNQRVGKRFLEVKHLTKSYGDRLLFKNAHFTIKYGEKLAIVGPNGSGKTTLLKVLISQERAEGDIWISPAANIGYLTQEVFDLPLHKTPEQLFYKETFEERGKVQNLMRHLGFTPAQWTASIDNMSMGERVKCKLMAYILEEKNVLILDEPTNHLDLPSREQLEQTLAQYNGTLLVVSHDRYFLEKTTEQTLQITNGSIKRQWQDKSPQIDDTVAIRLKLETERQEVLGRLSFLTAKDKEYGTLDQKFNELSKRINELS